MIDIAVLVMLVYMSGRIIRDLSAEAPVRAEFKIGPELLPFVALLPFGPAALFLAPMFAPLPLPHVIALACFIPALICARRHIRVLETAGTDRVQRLQSAVNQAFGTSLAGMSYVLASAAITYGVKAIGSDA